MKRPLTPLTDPARLAAYEDRINAVLRQGPTGLRVCTHPDRTATLTGQGDQVAVECDYCPEVAFTSEYGPWPVLPLTYYLDPGVGAV